MSNASLESLTWGLDPDQLAGVMSDARPLCLLAGAGAGKTRVLTRRVARRVLDATADERHVMVLTFTRKAAGELRDRLRGLGVSNDITVGTFHAIAFAQLRRRWLDQNRTPPQVSSNPIRVVEAAIENLRLGRSLKARHVAVEIAWAKSRNLTPENYQEGCFRFRHRPSVSAQQVAKVFEAYEMEKRKRKIVDYDDLLTLMTDAMRSDPKFAAAQRWKFRHFFVDEFQDLNSAQFSLLREWLGDRDDLFVVGDPNQAIYGWNGADSTFLTEIDHSIPNVTKLKLGTNYRSTAEVLLAAAAVLSEGEVKASTDLVAGDGVPPEVQPHVDEVHEATSIARRIRKFHGDGYRWGDIAVLVRTNAQRQPLEAALAKFGVPFRSAGGLAWMREPEVRDALDLLRHSVGSRLAQSAADIKSDNARRRSALESDGEPSVSKSAVSDSSTGLDELVKAMDECLADDPDLSVADFLSWIEVASRNDGPGASRVAGVTVSTFHRAKGLEWPVVFLAGIENGYVPLGGVDGAQVDEERRLFYVAITRARERLICTWAQQRGPNDREPSPWLAAIERVAAETRRDDVEPATAKQHLQETRDVLHVDTSSVDMREGLVKWRKARAKLTGVEPRLILADSIIDAIVDVRPESKEDLARIEGFGTVRAASIGEEILTALASSG